MQLHVYCVEMKAYNVKLHFYKFYLKQGEFFFLNFLVYRECGRLMSHCSMQKLTRIVEEVIVTGLLLKYVYI